MLFAWLQNIHASQASGEDASRSPCFQHCSRTVPIMEEEAVTKMERFPCWRAPGMNLALPLVLGVVIAATLAWFDVVSAGAAVWIGGSIAFIAAVGLTVGFSFLVSFVVPVLGLPALAMVGVRVVFDASVTATATTGVVGLVVALFLFLFSLQLRWVGPLLVRPVMYALAASGLVLGSYVLRNQDIWAAALSCSVLVVGGLVALRFGRVLPGASVCLGCDRNGCSSVLGVSGLDYECTGVGEAAVDPACLSAGSMDHK